MRSRQPGRVDSGFSLVELLVVLALIAILTLIGTPWMLSTLNRAKTVAAAKEASTMMQLARLESIKQGVPTQVQYVAATDSFLAFADNDRNGTYTAGTDRVIAQGNQLPKGVYLWGPTDAGAEGTHAIADWDTAADCVDARPGPIFQTDGSCNCAGAFRFRDAHGNFLETRILFPATSKIVIRKWFGGSDPDDEWFENGEAGKKWQW